MNMRNDELKEFESKVINGLHEASEANLRLAKACAIVAHEAEGQKRADWEAACACSKRVALAYEQAAALIEASLK